MTGTGCFEMTCKISLSTRTIALLGVLEIGEGPGPSRKVDRRSQRLHGDLRSRSESKTLTELRAKHLRYAGATLEHLTAVEENDDGCRNGKQVTIPGLGIGENRVHDVQVI